MSNTSEKPASKKAPAKKSAASGKTVTLLQIGSPIGRTDDQAATLIGLGLGKRHKQITLTDTPMVRGMIRKVQHLVKIIDNAA